MTAYLAAPAIRRRRHIEHLMNVFAAAGAIDPTHPKTLQEIGISDDDAFRRVAESGLFREAGPGLWYMDPDAVGEFRSGESRRALIGVVIALLILGIALAMALTRR